MARLIITRCFKSYEINGYCDGRNPLIATVFKTIWVIFCKVGKMALGTLRVLLGGKGQFNLFNRKGCDEPRGRIEYLGRQIYDDENLVRKVK